MNVKYTDLSIVCYGICAFLFAMGQSAIYTVVPGIGIVFKMIRWLAVGIPILLELSIIVYRFSRKFLWVSVLLAILIIGNIVFNEASDELLYILIFAVICSKNKPQSIFKAYSTGVFAAVLFVLACWFLGIIETGESGGRLYLGFIFSTFGPNLFFHAVLAYVAGKKDTIHVRQWVVILLLNTWFYIMTNTVAVFLLLWGLFIFYSAAQIEKVQHFILDYVLTNRAVCLMINGFSFIAAGFTILIQYLYASKYFSHGFAVLNAVLSNRLELGKIAFERYRITLFGQPIEWLTGTDGAAVTGSDYFYVDSSYLQVLLRYGIVMLIALCIFMSIVNRFGVKTKNINLLLGVNFFLVHCITDPQLLSFRYNPFLVSVLSCIVFNVGIRMDEQSGVERNNTERIKKDTKLFKIRDFIPDITGRKHS